MRRKAGDEKVEHVWEHDDDELVSAEEQLATPLGIASIQIAGEFAGGGVRIEVSNDGVNWHQLKDVRGDEVASAENAFFEVSTAAGRIRSVFTPGGPGAEVAVSVVGWKL